MTDPLLTERVDRARAPFPQSSNARYQASLSLHAVPRLGKIGGIGSLIGRVEAEVVALAGLEAMSNPPPSASLTSAIGSMGVMNRRFADREFLAGTYSIADMACIGCARWWKRQGPRHR